MEYCHTSAAHQSCVHSGVCLCGKLVGSKGVRHRHHAPASVCVASIGPTGLVSMEQHASKRCIQGSWRVSSLGSFCSSGLQNLLSSHEELIINQGYIAPLWPCMNVELRSAACFLLPAVLELLRTADSVRGLDTWALLWRTIRSIQGQHTVWHTLCALTSTPDACSAWHKPLRRYSTRLNTATHPPTQPASQPASTPFWIPFMSGHTSSRMPTACCSHYSTTAGTYSCAAVVSCRTLGNHREEVQNFRRWVESQGADSDRRSRSVPSRRSDSVDLIW